MTHLSDKVKQEGCSLNARAFNGMIKPVLITELYKGVRINFRTDKLITL